MCVCVCEEGKGDGWRGEERNPVSYTRCYIHTTPAHTQHIKCVAVCLNYTDTAHQTTHLSSHHTFLLTLDGGTLTWSDWL